MKSSFEEGEIMQIWESNDLEYPLQGGKIMVL
jgi:hypothetical protein